MQIIICSNKNGIKMKDYLKNELEKLKYDIIDLTDLDEEYINVLKKFKEKINKNKQNCGIAIDEYGNFSFMALCKMKGMIVAQVSDERTAYMTRGHNNARAITLGSELIGETLALNIARHFIEGKYDGGRHQIRIDMLNKMGKEEFNENSSGM